MFITVCPQRDWDWERERADWQRVRGACCAPLSFMIAELFYFGFVLFLFSWADEAWADSVLWRAKWKLHACAKAHALQLRKECVCVCVRMFAWICRNVFSALPLHWPSPNELLHFAHRRIADIDSGTTDCACWGVVSSARVWGGWLGCGECNVNVWNGYWSMYRNAMRELSDVVQSSQEFLLRVTQICVIFMLRQSCCCCCCRCCQSCCCCCGLFAFCEICHVRLGRRGSGRLCLYVLLATRSDCRVTNSKGQK